MDKSKLLNIENNQVNVFICQTPFQLFYSKILIDNFNIALTKTRKLTHLVIHSGLETTGEHWSGNITFLDVNNSSNILERFSKLKSAKRIINKITSDSSNKHIIFFIPHTGGLISNYIFYNKKFISSQEVEFNLYYEGVLSMYTYFEKFNKHHIKRYLTSLSLGHKYNYNPVIFPYNSPRINLIYTPIKKFTKGPLEKIKEIPFSKIKLGERILQENRYLILGGPIAYLDKFYKSIFAELESIKHENMVVYYKGHASFNTHHEKYKEVFNRISDKFKFNIVIIEESLPIEQLVAKIQPQIIYSYKSSALINIKLIFGESFDIVCVLDKRKLTSKELNGVYDHLNIKMKYID